LDDEYCVLAKPAGIACMPHESNAVEHLQECAARALNTGPLQARRMRCGLCRTQPEFY
jgi:hypothetical protein